MNGADKNGGWLKLHRKILSWGWYNDPPTRALFLHLLVKANWEDRTWSGMTVKAGQIITSRTHLSEEMGLSIQQTRTALKNLVSTSEITIETTNKYTLITLENWALYQSDEDMSTSKSTSKSTNDQPATNQQINQQLTSKGKTEQLTDEGVFGEPMQEEQPAINQQKRERSTTLKELRNKKDKYVDIEGGVGGEIKNSDILKLGSLANVRLTEEEHARLLKEFPDCAEEAIEFLSLWIAEKGDTSKSKTHNLTIRRWVIDAAKERMLKRAGLKLYQPSEKPKRNYVQFDD